MTSREEIAAKVVEVQQLRKSRTRWHEEFGVPISLNYAAFLTAVGLVEDALISAKVELAEREQTTKNCVQEVIAQSKITGRALEDRDSHQRAAIDSELRVKELREALRKCEKWLGEAHGAIAEMGMQMLEVESWFASDERARLCCLRAESLW